MAKLRLPLTLVVEGAEGIGQYKAALSPATIKIFTSISGQYFLRNAKHFSRLFTAAPFNINSYFRRVVMLSLKNQHKNTKRR